MKRDSLSLLGLSWDFAIIAGRAGAGRAAPCCAVCLALFWFSYVLKSKSTLRRERRDWWRFRPTSFPWDLLSKCQAVVLGESWTTLREFLFQEWVLHSLVCFPCFCRTSDFLSLILFWKCGGAVPCDKPWRILNSICIAFNETHFIFGFILWSGWLWLSSCAAGSCEWRWVPSLWLWSLRGYFSFGITYVREGTHTANFL